MISAEIEPRTLELAKPNRGFRSVSIWFCSFPANPFTDAELRAASGDGPRNAPKSVCDHFLSRTLAATADPILDEPSWGTEPA
jgi:hypothetical protein